MIDFISKESLQQVHKSANTVFISMYVPLTNKNWSDLLTLNTIAVILFKNYGIYTSKLDYILPYPLV